MKVAHILLVHKNPHQVARFLNRLQHPNVDCWIHIDKKVDDDNFKKLLTYEKVFFIQKNIKVNWGSYDIGAAMLQALREVINSTKKYDYINFLSGQDYLLYPQEVFFKYLTENKGKEFIGIQPYQATTENIIRIKKYHLNGYSFTGKNFLQKVINKILPDRKFPYSFEIKKGPNWFTITTQAAIEIVNFIDKNLKFVNYFKLVDCPEEFLFHTILYNSSFKSKIENTVFHYTDWSKKLRHPELLSIKNKTEIFNAQYFFARKFDSTIDTKILDAIDNERLGVVN
jgi:Core-2/I-Branching enzyme